MDNMPEFDFSTEEGRMGYVEYVLARFPQLLTEFDLTTEDGRIEMMKVFFEGTIEMLGERGINVERMIELRVILSGETDRGCALMASAYLDEALENYIRARLVDDQAVMETLFAPQGPIGTFSARTDLAYALGLISRDDKRNLDIIRRIRNKFAHASARLHFSTESIENRCRELTNHGFAVPANESPRDLFLRVIWGLAGRIDASTTLVTHQPVLADVVLGRQ